MHVLFVPWGQPTHWFHMVPLAWACRAAGHDVRVAVQPAAADAVMRSGMPAVVMGENHDDLTNALRRQARAQSEEHLGGQALTSANAWRLPEQVRAERKKARFQPFVKNAESMIDPLIDFTREWRPDVVVADPLVFAAPLLAHAIGVPMVHHLWGPAFFRRIGLMGPEQSDDLWTDDMCRLFERFGLATHGDYAAGTIDSCPDILQFPDLPHRIPSRFIPYSDPAVVPRWLETAGAKPRVCVSAGTTISSSMGPGALLAPRILPILADFDVEVVVTAMPGDVRQLGEMPPGARVAAGLPLHLLLPTCDVVVHQGGAGTMLTAAATGVPQLAIPETPDQAVNAEQLAAGGAGIHAGFSDGASSIKSALGSLLQDGSVRETAADLRREILARPTPTQIVGVLEEMV
jgi:UDP:flavonoid glycosyltransferase YjiC (YdhE family)